MSDVDIIIWWTCVPASDIRWLVVVVASGTDPFPMIEPSEDYKIVDGGTEIVVIELEYSGIHSEEKLHVCSSDQSIPVHELSVSEHISKVLGLIADSIEENDINIVGIVCCNGCPIKADHTEGYLN